MNKISVKIKQKKSVNPDRPMPVYLQIIYRRKVGHIPLEYKLTGDQWDAKNECIRILPGSKPGQVLLLHAIDEKLKEKKQQILTLAHTLEAKDILSVPFLLATSKEQDKALSLTSFMQQLIRELDEHGQYATSRHYQSTLNKFALFSEAKDMQLADINETVMKQFESYLVEKKLAPNTVSFYLRIMQATWNKAVNMGLLPAGPSPFRQVNTRVEKTIKRAVEEKVITRLAKLTEKELLSPALQFARDMFLFSYYARGMSYIDIAFLKKKNIRGNMLVYKRRKTGQELKIRLLPEMKAIIKRYAGNNRVYLFPILHDDAIYRNYESALRLQNKQLKILGELVGAHLTTYVARHTWASIASQKGVPLDLIAKGLGHTSEKATHIYIARLDNPRLDRANDIVIHGKMKYKNKMDIYAFG